MSAKRALRKLADDLGVKLPNTLAVQTPSGGLHLYYKGTAPPSASAIAEGVDIRSLGSYVLCPGSNIDGTAYSVVRDCAVADAPAPLLAKANADKRDHVAASEGIELDSPGNKARARTLLASYVAEGKVAIDGQGGDTLTYAVAAEVMNLGLSPEMAFEVMQDWDQACQPPWGDDLRAKIENANKYAQNEPGAYAVPTVEQRIPAEALDRLKAESEASAPKMEAQPGLEEDRYEWRFEIFNAAEDANLPPITYHDENKLWPKIPGGSLTQIIAQAKGYKTTFYLSELFRLVARELKGESK